MYNIKKYFRTISLVTFLLAILNSADAQTISADAAKKNITHIHNPLKNILKLEPRVFEYDADKFNSYRVKQGKQYGFLAENMQEVFPGMVSSKNISYMYGKNTYRDTKIQTIDEVSLIPVLVASIQELHNEIEQLKMEIKKLKTN